MTAAHITIDASISTLLAPRWWLPVSVVRLTIADCSSLCCLWPLPLGEPLGLLRVGSLSIPLRLWVWE